ncbi:hypothetical protein H4R35_007300, partial [Dimargaris xerosporica]
MAGLETAPAPFATGLPDGIREHTHNVAAGTPHVAPGQQPLDRQLETERVVEQLARHRPEGESDPDPIHP